MSDCAIPIRGRLNMRYDLSGSIPPKVRFSNVFSTLEEKSNLSAIGTSAVDQIPIYMEYAKMLDNRARVVKFANLDQNWNGYGSTPIPRTIIERTLALISNVKYQPKVFPTARSTIQLEYDSRKGSYLEIEIDEDYYTITQLGGSVENEYQTKNDDDINNVIEEYHA